MMRICVMPASTKKKRLRSPAVEAGGPGILIAWLGKTDLRGLEEPRLAGPIADFLRAEVVEEVLLLAEDPQRVWKPYAKALSELAGAPVNVWPAKLPNPMDYEAIYRAADAALEDILRARSPGEVVVHMSPGTPAMAAVWLLLAKTRHQGLRLVRSWLGPDGVPHLVDVEVPFELSLEFLPDILTRRASLLEADLSTGPRRGFDRIVHRSPAMQRLLATASRAALFPNPVLILGESGTGKELLARALHEAGPRHGKAWVPRNCGALSPELIDSELFGSVKGAFTGAVADRVGCIEAANGGTVFLDEVGEMRADTQVRLLRFLQEGEIQRVGDTKPRSVDVRVVAATHRDLAEMVRDGGFRDDLFYRLAVIVLTVPPLRERKEDIPPLAEHFLAELNRLVRDVPDLDEKRLSPSGREFLLDHDWPGNVRELENTLARVVALLPDDVIRGEDLAGHLIGPRRREPVGSVVLGDGVDVPAMLADLERRYIREALMRTDGVKTRAAKLLGYRSRQALEHRMKALGA